MMQPVLDTTARTHVVEELARLLKAFHETEGRNEGGFESVSRRGLVGGFRFALEAVVGRDATSEILAVVREETGLQFPHVGPVTDEGEILGFDSEAAIGL